jgi:hypothetical protein
MADELHTPNHRWYEPRNHIPLAKEDVSKQWIFNSGIQKINAWINSQPWGNPIAALFANNEPGVWYDPSQAANLDWRRNLLTFTEQFDNAAWVKSGCTVTDQGGGVWRLQAAAGNWTLAQSVPTNGVNNILSIEVKSNGAGLDNARVLFSGIRIASFSATDEWQRVSVTGLHNNNASANGIWHDGSAAVDILIRFPQFEVGSTATEYQRISDVNTEVRERFPEATLFQDTAGTTPVTTPGQTVALMLDKSKGLTLGPELVTNGDFSILTTDWWALCR